MAVQREIIFRFQAVHSIHMHIVPVEENYDFTDEAIPESITITGGTTSAAAISNGDEYVVIQSHTANAWGQ